MTNESKVQKQLKTLEERAAKDVDFLNYLKELEMVIDMENENGGPAVNARSRLPYSSEPPTSEAIWN